METIPQDLTEAIRSAAEAAPDLRANLTDVHRRVRRRRNRQAVLSALGVVVVLAATGIGVANRRADHATVVVPAVSATPSAPVFTEQRLMLNGASGLIRTKFKGGEQTVELGAASRVGALEYNGFIDAHDVVGAQRWDTAVGLPDGKIVAFSESEARLVMTSQEGVVWVRRDVGHDGEPVTMPAASAEKAYLLRPAGLVEHDIDTGAETTLMTRAELNVPDHTEAPPVADVGGGWIAFSQREQDGCSVRSYPRGEPQRTIRLAMRSTDCEWVSGIRISPDGTMIAAVYQEKGQTFGVEVFRIVDGTYQAGGGGVAFDQGEGANAGRAKSQNPLVAIAWSAPHRVRGASYQTRGEGPTDLMTFDINW